MSSVPLAAMSVHPPEQPDLLGQYGKAIQLRNLVAQSKLIPGQQQIQQQTIQNNALNIQQKQKEIEDQQKIEQMFSNAGDDPSKLDAAINQARAINPQLAAVYQKSIFDAGTAKLGQQKAILDLYSAKTKRFAELIGGVTDQQSHDEAFSEAMKENLIPREQVAQRLAAPFDPASWEKEKEQILQSALTAQEHIAQKNKEIDQAATAAHNKALEEQAAKPKPGVDIPFPTAVAEQKKELAQAGRNAATITVQTVDPQGNPVTKIVPKVAGAEYAKPVNPADIRQHDKDYVVPANAIEKSYQMMQHAYDEYKAAKAQGKELPTGAQSMVALSTHLATTFGNVKGSRITRDMIEKHLGARGIGDKALTAVQSITNGDVLSPDQWAAFSDMIGQSRKLSWDTAVKEADRKHIPVDFLPSDLAGGAQGGGQTASKAAASAKVIKYDKEGNRIP